MKHKQFYQLKASHLLFLFLILSLILMPIQVKADEEVTIVKQPESQETTYPKGASFHVEVNNSDLVKSYQWFVEDVAGNIFELKGESAKTDTLIVPSTSQFENELKYYCVIKDQNDKEIQSEVATLNVTNREENLTVLYIGEYALLPGESLDLKETTLGSGIVTFDQDGANITLDNVVLTTEKMIMDTQLAQSLGIFLSRKESEVSEYYFHIVGDCSLTDTFYDPDYNSAGVVFNAFFGTDSEDGNRPTIVIDGDGTLTLNGGSNAIYTDGNIDINTKVITRPNGDIFQDGIRCFSLLLEEKADLDLQVNGTGIAAFGDIRAFEGSKVNIESSAKKVSVGPTVKSIIFLGGTMVSNGSSITIKGHAKKDDFVPAGGFLANYNGISMEGTGSITLTNTDLTITMDAENNEEPFAANFNGIIGGDPSNALSIDSSKVNIEIVNESVMNTNGINIGGIFEASNDSEVNVKTKGLGENSGIEVGREMKVEEATVNADVDYLVYEAAEEQPQYPTYGIVTGGFNIKFTDDQYQVHSIAKDGIGFAADTGERAEGESQFTKDYQSTMFQLDGDAKITTPTKSAISTFNVPGFGEYIVAEAVFDTSDTTKPAQEILISTKQNTAPSTNYTIIGMVTIVALVLLAVFMKKRKQKES